MQLPGINSSLWRETYTSAIYTTLQDDLEVDVAIVGGGITGLTAAYLLKQAGLKVAVLEKDTVGGGTTGRTTGKVTSQHNLIYADFAGRLGEKVAKLYGEANQAAVEQVAAIVKEERIDCDWQRDDNYVYTANPSEVETFRIEAETAARLGLPASFETDISLPFEVQAAVKFAEQAKFNAQKYVLGLAKAVNGNGSNVFEHSHVISIRDGTPARVKTHQGRVIARDIIVATNVPTLPLMARGGYCLLEYPTESYIVVGRLPKLFNGMYISPDDNHYSVLPFELSGKNMLLIGGESHISGMTVSKAARYQKLAVYAKNMTPGGVALQ